MLRASEHTAGTLDSQRAPNRESAEANFVLAAKTGAYALLRINRSRVFTCSASKRIKH